MLFFSNLPNRKSVRTENATDAFFRFTKRKYQKKRKKQQQQQKPEKKGKKTL